MLLTINGVQFKLIELLLIVLAYIIHHKNVDYARMWIPVVNYGVMYTYIILCSVMFIAEVTGRPVEFSIDMVWTISGCFWFAIMGFLTLQSQVKVQMLRSYHINDHLYRDLIVANLHLSTALTMLTDASFCYFASEIVPV